MLLHLGTLIVRPRNILRTRSEVDNTKLVVVWGAARVSDVYHVLSKGLFEGLRHWCSILSIFIVIRATITVMIDKISHFNQRCLFVLASLIVTLIGAIFINRCKTQV